MLEVGSLLSLFGAVNTTVDFCKNVSVLWQGQDRDRLLQELVDHNRAMREGIERLSDQILYAPGLKCPPHYVV